jgi:N-acetylmuramoyl-L-alanine amidase
MTTSEGRILAIDPGHAGYNEAGQYDVGAVGPGGVQEADVALAIGGYLAEMAAAAGWQPLMTRVDQNGQYNLTPRAAMANQAGAVAFISIHANSFSSPQANGYEVWTAPGQTESDDLATAVYDSIAAAFPQLNGRPDLSDGDPDKEERFTVLTATSMPAILVETAFISNPTEEQLLANPEGQRAFDAAIWAGIVEWDRRRGNE